MARITLKTIALISIIFLFAVVLQFIIPSVRATKMTVPMGVKLNYQETKLPAKHLPINLEFALLESIGGQQLRIFFFSTGENTLEETTLAELIEPPLKVGETWRYQAVLEGVSSGIIKISGGARLEYLGPSGQPPSWAGKADSLYIYTNTAGEITKITRDYPEEWKEYDWYPSPAEEKQIVKIVVNEQGVKIPSSQDTARRKTFLFSLKIAVLNLFNKLRGIFSKK